MEFVWDCKQNWFLTSIACFRRFSKSWWSSLAAFSKINNFENLPSMTGRGWEYCRGWQWIVAFIFFSKKLASSVGLAGCCQEKQLFVHSLQPAGWALALIYLVSAPLWGKSGIRIQNWWEYQLISFTLKASCWGIDVLVCLWWGAAPAGRVFAVFPGNSWLFSMSENNRIRPYIFPQSYLKLN